MEELNKFTQSQRSAGCRALTPYRSNSQPLLNKGFWSLKKSRTSAAKSHSHSKYSKHADGDRLNSNQPQYASFDSIRPQIREVEVQQVLNRFFYSVSDSMSENLVKLISDVEEFENCPTRRSALEIFQRYLSVYDEPLVETVCANGIYAWIRNSDFRLEQSLIRCKIDGEDSLLGNLFSPISKMAVKYLNDNYFNPLKKRFYFPDSRFAQDLSRLSIFPRKRHKQLEGQEDITRCNNSIAEALQSQKTVDKKALTGLEKISVFTKVKIVSLTRCMAYVPPSYARDEYDAKSAYQKLKVDQIVGRVRRESTILKSAARRIWTVRSHVNDKVQLLEGTTKWGQVVDKQLSSLHTLLISDKLSSISWKGIISKLDSKVHKSLGKNFINSIQKLLVSKEYGNAVEAEVEIQHRASRISQHSYRRKINDDEKKALSNINLKDGVRHIFTEGSLTIPGPFRVNGSPVLRGRTPLDFVVDLAKKIQSKWEEEELLLAPEMAANIIIDGAEKDQSKEDLKRTVSQEVFYFPVIEAHSISAYSIIYKILAKDLCNKIFNTKGKYVTVRKGGSTEYDIFFKKGRKIVESMTSCEHLVKLRDPSRGEAPIIASFRLQSTIIFDENFCPTDVRIEPQQLVFMGDSAAFDHRRTIVQALENINVDSDN